MSKHRGRSARTCQSSSVGRGMRESKEDLNSWRSIQEMDQFSVVGSDSFASFQPLTEIAAVCNHPAGSHQSIAGIREQHTPSPWPRPLLKKWWLHFPHCQLGSVPDWSKPPAQLKSFLYQCVIIGSHFGQKTPSKLLADSSLQLIAPGGCSTWPCPSAM